MLLVGLALPILFFFISMNVTYSFFTATAKKQVASTTIGTIRIGLTNDQVQVNSEDFDSQKIVPGDEISISARVINQGSAGIYAILKFTVNIVATDTSYNKNMSMFYSFDENGLVEILSSSGTCFVLETTQYQDFSISTDFSAVSYGNEFQQATVSITLSAYSIQTANLTLAQATTELLTRATQT